MRQDHVEEMREIEAEERQRVFAAQDEQFARYTPRVLPAGDVRVISPLAAARQGTLHSAKVIADLQATIAAMHEETL